MDKIITINLGGYAIRMEEDAYEALKPYIRQIELAFANTENGKEIINDIEARIAEMLAERTEGKVAASMEDVEFVKAAMGNPGEFAGSEAEEAAQPKQGTTTTETVRKRLYRNSEDKVFGGVCSGIASYFNLDSVVIRLIWIGLVFFFGTGLLFYFILWAIVPEAVTTAQKLEMKGEAPTFDNIVNRVKTEAGKVEQNLKSRNIGQRITEALQGLTPVLLVIIKIVALMFGIAVLVMLSGLFIGLIAGSRGFIFHDNGMSFHGVPNVFDTNWEFVSFKTVIGLFLGIPLFVILTGLLKFVFNTKVNYRPVRHILGWVWVATIPLMIYFIYSGFRNLHSFETITIEKSERVISPLAIKAKFNRDSYVFDNIQVEIVASDDSLVHISIDQSANGKNSDYARLMAEKNGAGYTLTGNELILKTSDYFFKNSIFRNQKVEFTVAIPEGTKFTLDPSLRKNGVSVTALNINYYTDHRGQRSEELLYLKGNLFCPACPDSIPYGSSGPMNYSNFDKIEVEGNISVEIHRGNKFHIQKVGPANIVNHMEINQINRTLEIRMEHGFYNLRTSPRVIITMPELAGVKLSGATECKTDLFSGGDFSLDCSGASQADLQLNYSEIDVDVSGASEVNISGMGRELDLDASGSSSFNGPGLSLQTVKVELSGSSDAQLGDSKSISGEVSGASELQYSGSPSMNVNSTGAGKVRHN